jgi:AraC family transcriptional regulator
LHLAAAGLTPVGSAAFFSPLIMNESFIDDLDPPRLIDGKALLIAGIGERYNEATGGDIAAQWQRFAPYLGKVPGQIGTASYGVCLNAEEVGFFDYVCGVEVSDFAAVPPQFMCVRVPERRYAVFLHRGHVSAIRRTLNTIWNKWLPESGLTVVDAPAFERYDERYDPRSGTGDVEIWLPVDDGGR